MKFTIKARQDNRQAINSNGSKLAGCIARRGWARCVRLSHVQLLLALGTSPVFPHTIPSIAKVCILID